MKKLYVLVFATVLAACGGGSGGGGTSPVPPPVSPPPPPANLSPGGLWSGTRANGTVVALLITESGELRLIDEFGNQGEGQAVVTNVNEFSLSYTLFPPFEDTLIDGSDSAACMLEGTLVERQTLDVIAGCTTSLGTVLGGNQIIFTYGPEYELTSSLARIAGFYDDFGAMFTVDLAGAVFEQNQFTGCVMNGQVSLLDTARNLYDVSFTTDNCQGNGTVLNGSDWNGLATIVNVGGVETLLGAFSTQVGATLISKPVLAPRL